MSVFVYSDVLCFVVLLNSLSKRLNKQLNHTVFNLSSRWSVKPNY